MNMFLLVAFVLLFHNLLGVSSKTLSYSGEYNNGGDTFELSIEIGETNTTISVTGPSNKWLAIGFGSLTMDASYNIVYGRDEDSSPLELIETYTNGHDEGDYIKQCSNQVCAKLQSSVTVNNRVTLIITRNNDEGGSKTYQFDNTASSLETIWGIGRDIKYDEHNSVNYGAITVVFESTVISNSSASIFQFPLTEIAPGTLDISFGMWMNQSHVTFELLGPNNKWFGVGWGGHFGGDLLLYTTGFSGDNDALSLYDYYFGGQTVGSTSQNYKDSSQDWTINNITEITSNSKVYIEATRALDTGDSDDIAFTFGITQLSFYFAEASSNTDVFSYHGSTNRYLATIYLSAGGNGSVSYNFGGSSNDSDSGNTGSGASAGGGADYYEFAVTEIESGSGIYIGIYMDKNGIDIDLYGPNNKWFGLCWGDTHFGGDCALYTTGLTNTDDINMYDYVLNGQTIGSTTENYKDNSQDWNVYEMIDGVTYNGDSNLIHIQMTRELDTSDSDDLSFSLDNPSIVFYFAKGVSNNNYQLEYHSSNRYNVKINLAAGTLSSNEVKVFTTKEHAIWMFVAFGVIIPFVSIFLNRYSGLILATDMNKTKNFYEKYSYLIIQIHRSSMVIAYVCAIIGWITQYSNLHQITFNSFHSILGYVLLIFITLQIIISLFKLKIGINESKNSQTILLIHQMFGRSFIIISFITMFAGIIKYFDILSIECGIFTFYTVILMIIVGLSEKYYRSHPDIISKSKSMRQNIAFDETATQLKLARKDSQPQIVTM